MIAREFKKKFYEELAKLEKDAGSLPGKNSKTELQNIDAIWVFSGTGSFLRPIINTPSDNFYKKHSWYGGQDRARLEYASRWLRAYKKQLASTPELIYNGTTQQNLDLKKAINDKKIDFSGAKLFIPKGEIIRTLDQVEKFSLPSNLKGKKIRLALISHSAHIPRILRFIAKYQEKFKNIEIVPFPINLEGDLDQKKMAKLELENLDGYIKRGEAAFDPYQYRAEIKVDRITKDDLLDIFELSNQKSIRAVSFNKSAIKLDSHKKWFATKLKDKNSIMLKATVDGRLAGQVRLDVEGEQALIGISVSENFRGKGIASILLEGAKSAAQKRKIAVINAFIKQDNEPSIGLFEKNGWVYSCSVVEGGIPAFKYIWVANPLSKKKTLMVLGAGFGQVPAIKEAKKLGIKVLAIDRNPEAPGLALADVALPIDTTDIKYAVELASRFKINGVMTMQTDISVPTVGKIVDSLKLPGVGLEVAKRCSNKILTRRCLKKKKINQPEFKVVSSIQQAKMAANKIGFPVVVKAPDSSASRGVIKVSSIGQIPSAFLEAKKYTKQDILIEEYVEGVEIGAQSFSVKGKCQKVLIHNDTVSDPPYMIPIGHSYPSILPKKQFCEAEKAVREAVEALGINDGPANIDLIVCKQGKPKILEIGARIGATCLPELTEYFTEINWTREAIRCAIGEKPNLFSRKSNPCAALILTSPEDGVVEKIKIPPPLSKTKGLLEFEIAVKVGDKVAKLRKGTDRIGKVVCSGDSAGEAERLCKQVKGQIKFKIKKV